MGLLDKARDTQIRSIPSPVGKTTGTGENLIPLFERIDAQAVSLDYGPQIFKILSDAFAIEKGVLFFKSGSDRNFISLCSSGYDVTTNNRLRLGRSFFDDERISSLLSKRVPFVIDGPSPVLQDIFSTREFGMIENMYFIPIVLGEELISLIIITAWKEFLPENWDRILGMAAERISLPLSKSRMALIRDGMQYGQNEAVDYKQLLQDILLSDSDNDYYIIKLNLNLLIDDLIQEKDGFRANHIKDEILSVFKTMSGLDVNMIELPNNFILLIQKKDKVADIDLYLFQLAASLPLLYTSLETAPDLQAHVYAYKSNTDTETILKDLF